MTQSVAREPLEAPAHRAGRILRRDGASALRADVRLWLLGLAIVTLCSWARWLATGSLKVDESYPSEVEGTLLLFALSGGYALLVIGWKGLLERPLENPRRLAFAGVAVAALMLPMLSNDVFSVFAYGSLAARGQDVYTTSSALHTNVWYPWIGEHWRGSVCVYGPSTLLTMLPASLAGGHPWLALFALRVAWLVPLAVVMELSFRHFGRRPFFHAMVWLNPLFLLEGPGQLHTDLLGVMAVTLGIVLQERGNLKSGWAMYGLALLGKYSFALTGSWFWLSGARTTRHRVLRLPAMVAVIVPLGVACFTWFWRGAATIMTPLRTLAAMNPGGTLTEVFGYVVHFVRGRAAVAPETPVAQAEALMRVTHGTSWLIASFVLGVVALSIGICTLRAMLWKPADEKTIALGTGVLVVVVATIASRRFEPWYLMAALPFFGLGCTDEWRRWWVAAVAASVAPTLVNVLPRTASILPAWSVITTTGLMVVFLSSFRSRYLSLGDERAARVEETSAGLLGVAEG